MTVVEVLLLVLVALVVVAIVLRPLSRAGRERAVESRAPQVADLTERKEACYRQIREAELDRATGKLTDEDWRVIDRQLRAEAAELLRRLDEAGAGDGGGEGPVPSTGAG